MLFIKSQYRAQPCSARAYRLNTETSCGTEQ